MRSNRKFPALVPTALLLVATNAQGLVEATRAGKKA